MNQEELLSSLQKYGLSQYESKAYLALLTLGTSNAYTISKESKIPRSRVYDVLESLAEKGLAMLIETNENAKEYAPLPSDVFMNRMKNDWNSDFSKTRSALLEIEMQEQKYVPYVFTLKGEQNIVSYTQELLEKAKKYVLFTGWQNMHDLLKDKFTYCQSQHISVLGLGHDIKTPAFGIEPHLDESIHEARRNTPWFILSVDGEKMIYGYSPELNKEAFYTEDKTHIYLMEDYIKHDLLINRIMKQENTSAQIVSMMQDINRQLEKGDIHNE